MRVEAFDRFVQINIETSNEILPKILNYAKKYFQKQYHLSTSILILDDGERFKKDYLINWAYHAGEQSQIDLSTQKSLILENILESSHLPIRIKITSDNSLLECINISFKMLGMERAVLVLDKPNHIAKRYVGALLSSIVINSDLSHIYLDATKKDFWLHITNMIGNKIIHNVRLEFDYDSFKAHRFGGRKGFKSSYLTKSEQKLHSAYATLGCDLNDDFFKIRGNYLELIKKYHPDKVFNQDSEIVEEYNLRFLEVKEAFDIIKASLEK